MVRKRSSSQKIIGGVNYEEKSKYCSKINTIEDLVKFPINHCLNGEEYTNNEAYQAYKIKVKELVGIDL